MSLFRFHRSPLAGLAVAALTLGFSGLAAPTARAMPLSSDMLPLSKVRAGMKGYGLTTFRGNKVSRFEVTVIDVLKKGNFTNASRDLILIRMKGGPITERRANLVRGMSGSPIYLNGKLVGAFAYGESWNNEPIGMVTPIQDMLDAWDSRIPQEPSYYKPAAQPSAPSSGYPAGKKTSTIELSAPLRVGGRTLRRLVLCEAGGDAVSSPQTAVLHRATTYMAVAGLNPSVRRWLEKEMEAKGLAVTLLEGAGGGGISGKMALGKPTLAPGSAFGTYLMTGDIEFGGAGTVTYRRGNRFLGFGHPLMDPPMGAVEMAVTSVSVADVFSGLQNSHLIWSVGPVVGSLVQDRDFAVSGVLGRAPRMIPFEVTVRDRTEGRSRTFRSRMFSHPQWTQTLMQLMAQQAVAQTHNNPGDVMATVETTVDAAEIGTISRKNVVFDANAIAGAVTQDLADIATIVSGNPFYPLPVRSGRMTVDITSGHNTATVERIFLKQGKYEPGDTVEIGVVLKPYRREAIVRTLTMRIPASTPTGRYQLQVFGGAPMSVGPFRLAAPTEPLPPPVNVRQMAARLLQQNDNTDVVARLTLNSVAPAVEGEKLNLLPPNIAALMASTRNSGVRLQREELKAITSTEYVVSGRQELLVNVVRRNTQEAPQSGVSGSITPGSLPVGLPSGLSTSSVTIGASAGDDELANAERAEGDVRALTLTESPLSRWLGRMADLRPFSAGQDKSIQPPAASNKPGDKAPNTTGTAQVSATQPPPPSTVPATPAPNPANDRPVARPLKTWRQTAKSEFASGKFTGTSVTSAGDLRLTPSLRRLAATPETYIWSLAADSKGVLYAGTGTSGKILKVDAQGKSETMASLPVVAIHSLLLGRDANLYAGSGVKGELYRVSTSGAVTKLATLPDRYILALAQDSKGGLYIGTGGGNTVYRLDTNTPNAKPVPFVKVGGEYVLTLATDPQDNLYVGTGAQGALLKVTPDGKSRVLFDARENSITAMDVDAKGNVFAATGPKAQLYRITPDGNANLIYDRTSRFFTSIKAAADGSVYAAAVDAIYHIAPSQTTPEEFTVKPLDNTREVDFISLTLLPDGAAAAGTGNIGEIFTSAPNTSTNQPLTGVFESVVHDARLTSTWGSARWNAQAPNGGRIILETRTGDGSEPDSAWSAWQAVAGTGPNEGRVVSPPARFLQYRLRLQAGSGATSPSVRDITFSYLPRNQAPRITITSPATGERWSGTQNLRWNGQDADGDTLAYSVLISGDNGATWKPLPSAEGAVSTSISTEGDIDAFRKRLEGSGVPEPLRAQFLAREVQRRTTLGNTPQTRDTSRSFDTKLLPDGVYQLKVVGTDVASNALDAQVAQAISEPFVIVNAVPTVGLTSTAATVGADRTVTIRGTATQKLTAVTSVQFRVDGGDWKAAAPTDGLFDSAQESYTVLTPPLPSGKHLLEVAAFNTAGGKTIEKLEVTVP